MPDGEDLRAPGTRPRVVPRATRRRQTRGQKSPVREDAPLFSHYYPPNSLTSPLRYTWGNEYTCTPLDPDNNAPIVVTHAQLQRISALQTILATFGKAGLIGDVTGTNESDLSAVNRNGNADWLFNRGVCIRSAMTPEERVRAEACIEELVSDEHIELTRPELVIEELSDEILPAKPRKPRPVIVGSCGHCSELLQKGKRLTCSRCKRATYCSKTCQKAAWGALKAQCTEPDN